MNNDKNISFPIRNLILFPFYFLSFLLIIISSFFCHFHSELTYFLSKKTYGKYEENKYLRKLEEISKKGKKKHDNKTKKV